MSGSNTCAATPGGVGNFTPGSASGNVDIPFGNAPKQNVIDAIDRAVAALGPGYTARITPHGGRNDRDTGTDNHPSGDAADTQLFYNGVQVSPADNPAIYQQYVSNLSAGALSRGIRPGIGGYDTFVHYDESPWRQGVANGPIGTWGNFSWKDAGIQDGVARAQSGITPTTTTTDGTSGSTPTSAGPDRPIDEQAKTALANCTPPGGNAGSSGGCSPVSAGALGALASLAGGAGIAIPAGLTSAVSAVQAATSGNILGAINAATGGLSGISTLVSGAVGRDVLATLSPAVAGAISAVGATSSISGLLGSVSPAITKALGVSIPSIGSVVDGVSKQILGSVPKFSSVFQLAQGAVGSAVGVAKALDQSVNKLFGTAATGLAATGSYLISNYDNMDIREMGGSYIKSLIGPLEETLPVLTDSSPMAPFGSLHKDYNAMITQGFGSLTTNLDDLGTDLSELGYLADMTDLFRIGTPGQICSQIVMLGVGYESGVLQAIHSIGLTVKDINFFESDDIAFDILGGITDQAAIESVLAVLEINRDGLSSLADLCDPEVLFPRSLDNNEFLNLNEIAPHLAMCGIGRIQTLAELGQMLQSMETLHDATALNALLQPTSLDEIDYLQTQLSPTSHYSGTNDLTVADFIGTAAGYTHTTTLPKIVERQEALWNSSITNNLQDLLALLQDTIDGVYTTSNVNVPNTGGYTFGIYTSLDDAVNDINDAILLELDVIKTTATDDDAVALYELQNYHNESIGQLYKEQYLRQQYGISIGTDSRSTERFYGDGATKIFTVTGVLQSSNTVDVYVDGVYQFKTEYTVDTDAGTITFTAAPASGKLIEVLYDNGLINPSASTNTLWNFATGLEDYGSKTGFGREGDFINKIVTDDYHGQRIKAVMIQSRNKTRAEAFGIGCTGENRVLSEFSNNYPNGLQSFTERTGIWASTPERAADVYVQLQDPDSTSRDIYYQRRLQNMKVLLQDNKEKAIRDILDSLIFVADETVIMTDLGTLAYDTVDPDRGIYNLDLLNTEPVREGFVMGPAVELITAFLDQEQLRGLQTEYNTDLSDNTKLYLGQIGIDIKKLVAVLQMTMISELANTFGLNLTDTRDLFGMPSVSRTILANLSRVD